MEMVRNEEGREGETRLNEKEMEMEGQRNGQCISTVYMKWEWLRRLSQVKTFLEN